jgi:hypothetical protein
MDKDLSKKAYIEAQVLLNPNTHNLLKPIVRLIETNYGLPPGSLGTGIYLETQTLSLLYLLIVVPKEFWNLDEGQPVYSQLEEIWIPSNIQILLNRSPYHSSVYQFIHHLRNAVAHVHFDFKDNYFDFWDQNEGKPEKYHARLSIDELQNFLEKVGSFMANLSNSNTCPK